MADDAPLDARELEELQQHVNAVLAAAQPILDGPAHPAAFAQLPACLALLEEMLQSVPRLQGLLPDDLLHTHLHRLEAAHELLVALEDAYPSVVQLRPPTEMGERHWRYRLDVAELQAMVDLHMTNSDIANVLGIGRATVQRHLQQLNVRRRRTEVSDAEATVLVSTVVAGGNQTLGETLLRPRLEANGIFLPREQLRRALRQVDPAGSTRRWMQTIQRRRYHVPFPNSLWHIDGYHKLIRYGFVVHGGIDGKTRLVVFLRASTNNEAATVGDAFAEAVVAHGLPSRVRGNYGGENLEVKRMMEEARGLGRGSFIQGRSVHNQRIERLWRDLWRSVSVYKSTFEMLQYDPADLLDPDSPIDLWCLHIVFLPMLNQSLAEFVTGWNGHRLRTERASPRVLWESGRVAALRAGFDILAPPQPAEPESECSDFANYGLSYDNVRAPHAEDPHVQLSSLDPPISEADARRLWEILEAERPPEINLSWGVEAYCFARQACNLLLTA